jgi:tetratricopeptide (TPR) repeat protein
MLAAQRYAEAWREIEGLLRTDPRDRDLLVLAIRAHHGMELHAQVLALCARAEALGPDPEVLHLRGEALRNLGRTGEALAAFAHAARLAPGALDAPLGAVAALEEAGRFAEARSALDAIAEQAGRAGTPLTPKHRFEDARLMVHEGRCTEAVAALDGLLGIIPPGFKQRRMALQLRVKACDRAGDFAGAWESAQRALAEARVAFDPGEYARRTDAMIGYWTRERARTAARSEEADPTAAFIAGMPRSGTSLVEQVIAAHPLGAGVGELRALEPFAAQEDAARGIAPGAAGDRAPRDADGADARRLTAVAREYLAQVRALHPRAQRIVNKSLFNDRMAAHLARLLPGTRIVHIQRDPRDVAVSCVLGGFNLDRLPWTARPEWVAHAWAESARLMRHWEGVLDVPFLQVRYETFVQEGVPAFARLIEFMGLPWDDAVTRFHAVRRTVQTLSYDQVNRPLYTSAVGRWRHYEAHLAGVAWPAYD